MKSIALPLLVAWLASLGAIAYAQRATAPPLVITSKPYALTITGEDGRKLVVVDMSTGKAMLNGDPNDAAREFWNAVGRAGMARCKPD